MNPRNGQYALGGSLMGWSRMTSLSGGQRRRLRAAYQGINPMVYGRYGVHQWTAALPRTRVVIKDPFAMLSLPVLVELTGALPVLIFRHPGAILASYRRMGWRDDLNEVASIDVGLARSEISTLDDVDRMGYFWATLNAAALQDMTNLANAIVVDHGALVRGGAPALQRMYQVCGLTGGGGVGTSVATQDVSKVAAPTTNELHRFDRTQQDLTEGWRTVVSLEEVARLESIAGDVLAQLGARALPVD